MEGNNRVNPPWLSIFLRASFFDPKHTHSKKVNFFCNDCKGDALCEDCHTHQHIGHNVLKVCKSTEYPAIPIEVIGRYIDITHIKPFKINSKHIVFLNSRQRKELIKGSSLANRCENCGWVIDGSSSYKFCSIACKLCPDMMTFANSDDRLQAVIPSGAKPLSSTKNNVIVNHSEPHGQPSNNFVIVFDHGKKCVQPSKKQACTSTAKKVTFIFSQDDEDYATRTKKQSHSTARNFVTVNHGEVPTPPANQPSSTVTKVSFRKHPRKAKHPRRAPLK